MFEYLQGELVEISASFAVIDVGGIGYKLLIPVHLTSELVVGKKTLFFTALIIREESHTLYGFLNKSEKALFEQLLSISGIGPKTAINLIGHLPLNMFLDAIDRQNIHAFTKVPGIGKKTAERLLLELKGKDLVIGSSLPNKMQDGVSALVNLGYSQASARLCIEKASKELKENCDLPSLISCALKMQK